MILIYEQDLTHYRASFYDFLSGLINEDICVIHGEGEPNSHHISVHKNERRSFKIETIKRIWFGRRVYFHSPFHLRKLDLSQLSCVIHRGAVRNLGLLLEIKYFKRKGIPVVIRGQGFSRTRVFNPNSNLVDRYHKLIVDSSNSFLCYTHGDKKILDQFSNPKKIVVGVNTLNTNILNEHYIKLRDLGRQHVKDSLGLFRKNYLCYVGRLSKRKRVDLLIDIYVKLKKSQDVGLIIIGGGEYEMELNQIISKLNIRDVVLTGPLSPDDFLTSSYIFASDTVVIPGWLGLAVNHAFILGTPIVGCIESDNLQDHGPEASYIVNGYNGILAKAQTEDSFIESINNAFDESLRLSDGARKYAVENLTVEKMAEGYIQAIEFARQDLNRKHQ